MGFPIAGAIVLCSAVAAALINALLKRWWLPRFRGDKGAVEKLATSVALAVVGAGLYLAVLHLMPELTGRLGAAMRILWVLLGAYIANNAFHWLAGRYGAKMAEKSGGVSTNTYSVWLLTKASTVFVFAIAMLMALDILGYKITPLLASLGIAGLAVALAAQDTLSNAIAGFAIAVVDRPFRIGDAIQLATGEGGIVLDIGMRSVRIRKPDGTLLVVPNSEMAKSRITRFPNRKNILIRTEVGIAQDVGIDKAVKMLLDAAKGTDGVADSPAPSVGFAGFEGRLRFVLSVWTNHRTSEQVRDALNRRIEKSLGKKLEFLRG